MIQVYTRYIKQNTTRTRTKTKDFCDTCVSSATKKTGIKILGSRQYEHSEPTRKPQDGLVIRDTYYIVNMYAKLVNVNLYTKHGGQQQNADGSPAQKQLFTKQRAVINLQ